jgi:hypothetical protein
MDKRRTRHWSWLALFVFLATVSSGCEMPKSGGTSGTASTSSSDEAERTRKMEEKAAEIERLSAEIQNMTGTEQEKIDAVNRLDEMRRELQELQDSGR